MFKSLKLVAGNSHVMPFLYDKSYTIFCTLYYVFKVYYVHSMFLVYKISKNNYFDKL